MAFLMDQSKLLANPGLKEGVREEASALFHIATLWHDLYKESKLHKYIIRRYGTTTNGVTLMFPGTLIDAAFDVRSQQWYIRAQENPGKVVVSPPFLDPGGGGLVITVSHTVYQVRSLAFSPRIIIISVPASIVFRYEQLSLVHKSIGRLKLNGNIICLKGLRISRTNGDASWLKVEQTFPEYKVESIPHKELKSLNILA